MIPSIFSRLECLTKLVSIDFGWYSIKIIVLTLFGVIHSGRMVGQVPYLTSRDVGKLIDARVNALSQDSAGFNWMATDKGLCRYDGHNFQFFNPAEEAFDQQLTSIFCEGQRVWVGTENGAIYFLDNQVIQHYQPEEGLPKVPVTGLLKDQAGRLWFCTYGEGVYVQDSLHLYNINEDDGILGNQIYQMAIAYDGTIWLATDNGVSVCRFENGKKSVSNLTKTQGLLDEIVYTLTPSPGGMWLGFQSNGLGHYSIARQALDYYTGKWSHGAVKTICQTDPNTLWIGTEEQGVYISDLNSPELTDNLRLISSIGMGDCRQIMLDQAGNIWIVMGGQWIYQGLASVKILDHDLGDIQAITVDGRRKVWVGTRHGLYELKEGSLQPAGWESENIISLYTDSYDRVWIGTFGDGIICWDPGTGQHLRLSERLGMINGSVFSIDGFKDQLWCATLGGIVILENDPDLFNHGRIPYSNVKTHRELNSNFFYKVFVDSRGDVWFGTDGQGVLLLQNGTVRNLLTDSILPAKTIYCMTEDSLGNIWIGTNNEGVYSYDGSKVDHFDVGSGLSNPTITSIAADAQGSIIMVHDNGIDIYDPGQQTFRYLAGNAGLENLRPGLNVVSQGVDGRIWVGGQNILAQYRENEGTSRTYPALVIDQVRLFDRPFDFARRKKFNHRENFLQFNYVGVWHSSPENIRYQYQLQGYDISWKTTRDQTVSYSNLGPGTYSFRVRCFINNQPIRLSEAAYDFTIQLPYWRRPWFIGLAALLSIAIFYSYQKYREAQINRKAAFERERIESQYEVLKAQINPHFLFNSFNTLASIVEEDSNTAVEYIEKLSDYYRSIIQFRNQKLIPLEEEIMLIDDFTYLLQKRFGKNLILNKEIENRDYYIPPLTLQMLVENAVKHNVISKQKPLKISIRSTKDDYLVVENNLQAKKTKEPSTRFGLQNIQTRFEMLTKKKVVISQNDKLFSVSIPLIKSNINQ